MLTNLPFDVLSIILQYYGKIKFNHKKNIYIDIIYKYDYRYKILNNIINNKINLIKNLSIIGNNNNINYYIDIFYKNDLLVKGLIFCKKLI